MSSPTKYPPVSLQGTEVRVLHSEILDQDFELYIKFPWLYDQGEKTYPVLYCLDGNRSFPLFSTMSLILETPGFESEEVLIVGIGYRVSDSRLQALGEWAAWRTRDLTPVNDPEVDQYWTSLLPSLTGGADITVQSGGAPDFLDFIRQELFPFIETNYHVSSGERGLAGFSYGGLFALYVLFHAPEFFRRYYAGSPSMWHQLFEYEDTYASTHDDLDAEILMTAGTLESKDRLERMQKFADKLQDRGFKGLNLDLILFEGEEHASSYAAGVSRALRELYGRDD